MNRMLAFAGRHGPTLLFFGVTIGFVFPTLASLAKPLMGVAVFVFSLGAFLKVDGEAFRTEFHQPRRAIAVLVWVSVGVPALAWAFASAIGFSTDMRLGIMLCMLGPPVGSAAAVASMLGLNAALALVVTIAISLFAPLYLPPIVAVIGGLTTHIDVMEMLRRIVAVIGTAAGAALLLRRFAGGFVAQNPSAMTGISVVGLLIVAIGSMNGMPHYVLGHGFQALELMMLAFVVNIGFQLVGFLLFAHLGVTDAMTVGLISGNRNVTLVWVVVAPWLGALPLVEAYLAASVFPIFMLPLVTKKLMAWQVFPFKRLNATSS